VALVSKWTAGAATGSTFSAPVPMEYGTSSIQVNHMTAQLATSVLQGYLSRLRKLKKYFEKVRAIEVLFCLVRHTLASPLFGCTIIISLKNELLNLFDRFIK